MQPRFGSNRPKASRFKRWERGDPRKRHATSTRPRTRLPTHPARPDSSSPSSADVCSAESARVSRSTSWFAPPCCPYRRGTERACRAKTGCCAVRLSTKPASQRAVRLPNSLQRYETGRQHRVQSWIERSAVTNQADRSRVRRGETNSQASDLSPLDWLAPNWQRALEKVDHRCREDVVSVARHHVRRSLFTEHIQQPTPDQ